MDQTPNSNEEFQTLKEEWISPFKQLRINSIERKLEEYKDPQAMYKAQGSNAFTRTYRKTMTRDDKLRAKRENAQSISFFYFQSQNKSKIKLSYRLSPIQSF